MKIAFTKPIEEEDIIRTGVTPDHYIVYPGKLVVINNKDGSHKSIPFDGLSKTADQALSALEAALSEDFREEYESGEVTKRSEAKKLKPVEPAVEPIKAEGEIK